VNIVASEIYSEFYLFLSRNCEIYTESKGKSRLYTAFVFIWEAERVKANIARFSKKPTYSKGKTKAKQRARMQEVVAEARGGRQGPGPPCKAFFF